ncbi:MAG: hypothetical protein EXS64_14780 [Candidatus Latescibacteria bacterium]|nr:hypothetical protein [Candidatus Latescibacterota bacterium]
MSFGSLPWWSAGLGIVGILLIILDRIGLQRAEQVGENLRSLAGDLSFRFWNPGEVVEALQDIYWRRRKSFFFVAGAAMCFVPAFTSTLYTHLWPVRLYLKGLLYAWAFIGAIYLPLMATGGVIWLLTLRSPCYPTGIDHLFGVAFWLLSRGLLLSLPAAVLLLAVPVAAGLLIVSFLTRLFATLALTFACLPLRLSRWTHERYALRLPLLALGFLLLIAGCTVQIVTTF